MFACVHRVGVQGACIIGCVRIVRMFACMECAYVCVRARGVCIFACKLVVPVCLRVYICLRAWGERMVACLHRVRVCLRACRRCIYVCILAFGARMFACFGMLVGHLILK